MDAGEGGGEGTSNSFCCFIGSCFSWHVRARMQWESLKNNSPPGPFFKYFFIYFIDFIDMHTHLTKRCRSGPTMLARQRVPHTQIIRKRSSTVVLARWVTVDRSWINQWNCMRELSPQLSRPRLLTEVLTTVPCRFSSLGRQPGL